MSQSYTHRQMTAATAEKKPPAIILLKPFRQFGPNTILTEVTGLLRDQLLNPLFGYARELGVGEAVVDGRLVTKQPEPEPTPVAAAPPKVVQQPPQPKLTMPDRTKLT